MSDMGRRKWSKPVSDIPPTKGLITKDNIPIQKASNTVCVDGETLIVLLNNFVAML
jgi:hypothetical protein